MPGEGRTLTHIIRGESEILAFLLVWIVGRLGWEETTDISDYYPFAFYTD